MKVKVTTEKRSGDWIAYAFGDRRVWEAGRSEVEAYGRLVLRLQGQSHIIIVTVSDEGCSCTQDMCTGEICSICNQHGSE